MMMLEWMDIWIDLAVVNFKYQICFWGDGNNQYNVCWP